MGYIDISMRLVRLPDGRPLLDEVVVPRRRRIHDRADRRERRGQDDTAAHHPRRRARARRRGVDRRRAGRHGPVRGARHDRARRATATVHDLLIEVAPRRIRSAAIELEAAEAAIIENDDLEAQLRYATALADYADAGGYEHETVWDPVHRRRARRAVRARAVPRARRRCRAASRSGSCWRRCCAVRTTCCCSTSPTTTSTCPASGGSRSSCARPRRPCCSSRTTASCSRGAPIASSRSRPARAGSTAWVHGGGFAHLPPGARRPHGPARRAAPALGRAARQDQGARRRPQGQGDRERRVRVALSGRPDAAREVRGGGSARRAPARAGPAAAAARAPAPASAPSSPSASNSPGS